MMEDTASVIALSAKTRLPTTRGASRGKDRRASVARRSVESIAEQMRQVILQERVSKHMSTNPFTSHRSPCGEAWRDRSWACYFFSVRRKLWQRCSSYHGSPCRMTRKNDRGRAPLHTRKSRSWACPFTMFTRFCLSAILNNQLTSRFLNVLQEFLSERKFTQHVDVPPFFTSYRRKLVRQRGSFHVRSSRSAFFEQIALVPVLCFQRQEESLCQWAFFFKNR